MLRSTNHTRTPSSTEPVTVAEVRKQLRIDHTEDDSDLGNMIAEARLDCETRLGDVSLLDATCIDYFDGFATLELHWGPVDSITSVTYVDTDGDTQTLATSVYELGSQRGVGRVRLKYGQTWPSTRSHADVVTVTYKAGYGATAASVPKNIQRWIKARVAWLYSNRDGEEYPWRFDSVLTPHMITRVIA